MPEPMPDCPICGGTGQLTDPELCALAGPDRAPGDPVHCLCMVEFTTLTPGGSLLLAHLIQEAADPPDQATADRLLATLMAAGEP